MKTRLLSSSAQCLGVVSALLVGASPLFSQPPRSKTLSLDTVIEAPAAEVWRAWTTSVGADEFLAPKTRIELRVGGPFEIFFDPNDETKSSRGKILSYTPNEMLSFQWSLPPLYPALRDKPMRVVVLLHSQGSARTRVTIEHFGWGSGPDWDDAFQHMRRGWSDLLARLQTRFAQSPIDWSHEGAQGADKKNFTLKARSESGS